ncbi:MAG: tetratricopeptide repeat protein, partial [Planctomycetaceae bacterium]|nr:tetratricopeptide repeat protein [Planctomycetaceae bacterium]
RLHQEKLAIVDALGDRRSRAVTLGDIARILTDQGEVDEALRLHQEQIAVYEALGDRRERAVTLGDIANIWMRQGKLDDAMAVKDEELATYRALGDRYSEAATHWEVAQIHFAREDIEQALTALLAAYPLFLHLGRLDGICIVGQTLGTLLCQAGLRDEGLPILERSRTGFLKLGQAQSAQECADLITRFTS